MDVKGGSSKGAHAFLMMHEELAIEIRSKDPGHGDLVVARFQRFLNLTTFLRLISNSINGVTNSAASNRC